jgi:hypothetical protein
MEGLPDDTADESDDTKYVKEDLPIDELSPSVFSDIAYEYNNSARNECNSDDELSPSSRLNQRNSIHSNCQIFCLFT